MPVVMLTKKKSLPTLRGYNVLMVMSEPLRLGHNPFFFIHTFYTFLIYVYRTTTIALPHAVSRNGVAHAYEA